MISLRYNMIRRFNSSLDSTRIPRSMVLAILPKNDSIMFSHDPCLGVKMNSKRLGTPASQRWVSFEMCAEWLSRTMRISVPAG